jgi:PST family polysaccharide transporter
MRHGRNIGVVSALTFVTTQVDNLIVGGALGAAALGLYLFAYRLSSLPVEQLHAIASAVGAPSYVRARAEGRGAEALAVHLRTLVAATAVLLCLAFLPAVLLREGVVGVLGGARWAGAADLLPPLALLALLRATAIHFGVLLGALERASLDARAKVVEACAFVPACALLVRRFGLAGACWAGVASYALAVALRTRAVGAELGVGLGPVTRAWMIPGALAAALALVGMELERRGIDAIVVALGALALFAAVTLRALAPEVERVRRLVADRRAVP